MEGDRKDGVWKKMGLEGKEKGKERKSERKSERERKEVGMKFN